MLDEEATVEAIAGMELSGRRLIAPVLRAVPERWFAIDLVIESDRAMELWQDEIAALESAVRVSGAFRRLRRWRLNIEADGVSSLCSASGEIKPVSALGGGRQLVLLATHGVSPVWSTGRMDEPLRTWARRGSLALLQMLPSDWWNRTPLGEANARLTSDEAGSTTSTGRIEPAWWVDMLDDAAIAVPMIGLDAKSLTAWADMVMKRGASVPAHLLGQQQFDWPTDTIDDAAIERRLAALRETDPRAFELATVLHALPFTISVARVVQDAYLQSRDARPLAALFLSGLLEPVGEAGGVAGSWFTLRGRARQFLARSLRRSDARKVASALIDRVSAHIQRTTGKAPDLTSFAPDSQGKYDLPAWAEPYARLAHGLRAGQRGGPTGSQTVDRLRELLSREVLGKLMRDAAMERQLRWNDDPALWDLLLTLGLTEVDARGERSLSPSVRETLIGWHRQNPLWGFKILWVDDVPDNNRDFLPILLGDGAEVIQVLSTAEAFDALHESYDAILSDMARPEGPEEGLRFLELLRERGAGPPTLIFAARYSRSRARRIEAVQAGAISVTNDFSVIRDVLLDLALDPEGAVVRAQRQATRALDEDEGYAPEKPIRRNPRNDLGLILNLDGEKRSAAGAWAFGKALREICGVPEKRIEQKNLQHSKNFGFDLQRMLEMDAARSDGTVYLYLVGGHDQPLRHDMSWEMERLIDYFGTRTQPLQIIAILDVQFGQKDHIRPSQFQRLLSHRPGNEHGSVMIVTDRNYRRRAYVGADAEDSLIPDLTRAFVEAVDQLASPGRSTLDGSDLEDELRMRLDTRVEIWQESRGTFSLTFQRREAESRILQPWPEWRSACLRFAHSGDNGAALDAIRAARVLVPVDSGANVIAELAVIEIALLHRLRLYKEALALLAESGSIIDETHFESAALYHQAACETATGNLDHARMLLQQARDPALALSIRRTREKNFAAIDDGFIDSYVDGILRSAKWKVVRVVDIAVPILKGPRTGRFSGAPLRKLVGNYQTQREEGYEARIVLTSTVTPLPNEYHEPYSSACAEILDRALELGLDRLDWVNDAPFRAAGTASAEPNTLPFKLALQRGPRRIFE